MLPDERLTLMLETAEEELGTDPQFLDGLFLQLVEARDARPVRSVPRPVARWAKFVAGLAAIVALAILASIVLQRRDHEPSTSPAPSASPSPGASASLGAGPSVAALPTEQLAWCLQHVGGPSSDQHAVEDMALLLHLVPAATSREAVLSRWDLNAPTTLVSDPTFVGACRGAYVTLSSAVPSASASPDPLIASIRAGMTEFDHAVTAARGPLGISDPDQSRLFQLEDTINARLDGGDLAGARTNLDSIIAYLATIKSRLDTDGGRRLQAAVDALDGLIPAG